MHGVEKYLDPILFTDPDNSSFIIVEIPCIGLAKGLIGLQECFAQPFPRGVGTSSSARLSSSPNFPLQMNSQKSTHLRKKSPGIPMYPRSCSSSDSHHWKTTLESTRKIKEARKSKRNQRKVLLSKKWMKGGRKDVPTPTEPLQTYRIKRGTQRGVEDQPGDALEGSSTNFFFSLCFPFLFANKNSCNYSRGFLFMQVSTGYDWNLDTIETIWFWHMAHSYSGTAMLLQKSNQSINSRFWFPCKSFKASNYQAIWCRCWLEVIRQIANHLWELWCILSSTMSMIWLHAMSKVTKKASDSFQRAIQYLENEKTCLTLGGNRIITSFIQRWQNIVHLLGSTLNSGVGGIYYDNSLLGLEIPSRPLTKTESDNQGAIPASTASPTR